MDLINKKNFLFENVSIIEGVGKKLSLYLKKKKLKKSMIYFGTFPTLLPIDLRQ